MNLFWSPPEIPAPYPGEDLYTFSEKRRRQCKFHGCNRSRQKGNSQVCNLHSCCYNPYPYSRQPTVYCHRKIEYSTNNGAGVKNFCRIHLCFAIDDDGKHCSNGKSKSDYYCSKHTCSAMGCDNYAKFSAISNGTKLNVCKSHHCPVSFDGNPCTVIKWPGYRSCREHRVFSSGFHIFMVSRRIRDCFMFWSFDVILLFLNRTDSI